MKLSAAEDAIRAGKPDVALQVLLEAWRSNRHPRLSELIERLSLQLTAAKGPITGKTVGQQHEAALALHAKKEPAELGRLLQVRWPGTWQKGVPLLQAMLAWEEDPRVEAAIAALLAEPPWDSMASWGFFSRLLPRIRSLSDPRVVPALEAAQSRSHPWWYERDFRPAVDATLQRLRTAELTLDDETGAALSRLESYFAESKTREKDKSRGEAELLADIYARPKDLEARAVFADWLTERGDPRGELITLQLASTRTRQQDIRLNALLKSHGSDWAGPLDEWFEREPRFFEAGFLTGGRFVERLPRALTEAVRDPGWRLINRLELRRWSPDIAPVLELAPLEALHGLEEALFRQLALGPPRALTEITLGPRVFDREVPAELYGPVPGLPKLHTLGVTSSAPIIAWAKRSELFKRVRRLRLSSDGPLRELLDFIRDGLPHVTEVEVLDAKPDAWLEAGDWCTTLKRASSGPFTEVYSRWSPGRGTFRVWGLVGHLGLVDPKAVTKVEVSASRTLKLQASDVHQLEETLTQFSSAEISVPWEREAAKKAAEKMSRTGPLLDLRLTGETLLAPGMEPLWTLLQELGLRPDSYGVGWGGSHRPLGAKPVVTLEKWAKNAKCHVLSIYEDGAGEELRLERPRHGNEASATLHFRWSEREVEPFLDWLETLLDRWKFDGGSASIGEDAVPRLILDSGPPGGWLTIFGADQLRFLPEKGLKTVLARFPGSFVRKTKRNLILGASKSPLEQQPLAELGKAVNELVANEVMRVHRVNFFEAANEALAPIAKKLGMKARPMTDEDDRGERRVVFTKEPFVLRARVSGFLSDTPRVGVDLRTEFANLGNWILDLGNEKLDSKTLPALFAAAIARLESDGVEWMEDPANFHAKRKRR